LQFRNRSRTTLSGETHGDHLEKESGRGVKTESPWGKKKTKFQQMPRITCKTGAGGYRLWDARKLGFEFGRGPTGGVFQVNASMRKCARLKKRQSSVLAEKKANSNFPIGGLVT